MERKFHECIDTAYSFYCVNLRQLLKVTNDWDNVFFLISLAALVVRYVFMVSSWSEGSGGSDP